jgi:hypothetical protein
VELTPGSKLCQGKGAIGQKVAKLLPKAGTKRKSEERTADLAESINNFTKAYVQIAKSSLLLTEKIAKDKADTNIKLVDMNMRWKARLDAMQNGWKMLDDIKGELRSGFFC